VNRFHVVRVDFRGRVFHFFVDGPIRSRVITEVGEERRDVGGGGDRVVKGVLGQRK
jgi:hypothetical protein